MLSAYFDYPLEQGLRQKTQPKQPTNKRYFDYPLEQGLRQSPDVLLPSSLKCILIIH